MDHQRSTVKRIQCSTNQLFSNFEGLGAGAEPVQITLPGFRTVQVASSLK